MNDCLPPDTPHSDIKVCLQILRVWKSMKSTIEEFAAERDLTLQQIFVVYHLYHRDQLLMGVLAMQMHCDASNITGLADRLQTMGYISRREMPEDRRAKQLAITGKGRELIDDLLPYLPAGLNMHRLTTDEMAQLSRLLAKLSD